MSRDALNPNRHPCPTCGQPNGWHDDEPHDEANARIPAHLRRLPASAVPSMRRGCLLDHPHDGPHVLPQLVSVDE